MELVVQKLITFFYGHIPLKIISIIQKIYFFSSPNNILNQHKITNNKTSPEAMIINQSKLLLFAYGKNYRFECGIAAERRKLYNDSLALRALFK